MTHAAAPVGVEYDNIDLQQSDLQWFFEIDRGLDEVPSVRGKDTVIPGLDGRFEQNRRNDTLSIVLRGFVQADPTLTDIDARRASYRANMQVIRELFQPTNGRADLVATLEDGSQQSISAVPLNIVAGTVIASEYRELSIELEGFDDWTFVGS